MQKATPPGWPSEDKDEGLLASKHALHLLRKARRFKPSRSSLRFCPSSRFSNFRCRAKLERLLAPYGIEDLTATTQGDLIGLSLVAGGQAFIGPLAALAPLGRPLTAWSAADELMDAFPARDIGGPLLGDFVLAKHFMLCAMRCWPQAETLPAHALARRIGDWAGSAITVDALLAALHALTVEPRERWREIINSGRRQELPHPFKSSAHAAADLASCFRSWCGSERRARSDPTQARCHEPRRGYPRARSRRRRGVLALARS